MARSRTKGTQRRGGALVAPSRSVWQPDMKNEAEPGGTVLIERTFSAPVARVWMALTDVEQMRHWFFDLPEFKADVGFEFEFVVEHEGNSYHHLCCVTEVVPE